MLDTFRTIVTCLLYVFFDAKQYISIMALYSIRGEICIQCISSLTNAASISHLSPYHSFFTRITNSARVSDSDSGSVRIPDKV